MASTAANGGVVTDRFSRNIDREFSNGIATGQADTVWHGSGELASGASVTFDLRGGLTNALGQPSNFVKVRAWAVENTSASATITVEPCASAPWATWAATNTAGVVVRPSGTMVMVAPSDGFAVASDTGDMLTITNAETLATATYNLWMIGTSQ